MKTLVFLSRVTFMYNLCMIITLLMGYLSITPEKELKSTILVAGLFLSIVFNGLVSLWMVLVIVRKRSFAYFQPGWLFVINFLCFLFQIYMLLK